MNRLRSVDLRLPFLGLALVLAACAGGVSSGAPSPSAPTSVTSPAAAAARVQEVVPALAGIGEKQSDVIGACCFWEAEPSANGFRVVFEVGWGDCPSGCIDRHRWTYDVSADGAVQLAEESGPAVPSGVPGSGVGGAGSATTGGGGILPGGSGISGRVTAGPTCPVVTVDNPCDDRPIVGAPVVVLDASGREVGRVMTDADGRYSVTLAAGPYSLEPQPIEGLMRAPEPTQVTVGDGFTTVDLSYDTGIR